MKKVFSVAATLLMIGMASQASAAFDKGGFTLAIYDDQNSHNEWIIDLGAITDFTAQNQTLASGIDLSAFGTGLGTGVGIWADQSTTKFTGYFATGSEITPTGVGPVTSGKNFRDRTNLLRSSANTMGSGATEVLWSTGFSSSFATYFVNGASAGNYAGVNLSPSEPKLGTADIDMYLYHFNTTGSGATTKLVLDSPAYLAKFTLTTTGDLVMNASSDVPVPGALVLLGSGLAGLAGIRRRKNS